MFSVIISAANLYDAVSLLLISILTTVPGNGATI